MTSRPEVVLYGGSIFLAGIQAQLERDTTLGLIAIAPGQPDGIDLIRAHRPRAVLFDLNLAHPDFASSLLLKEAGLLLIGVDPSRDELLILYSYPVQALSVHDLVRLILEHAPYSEEARPRPEGFHP